MNEHKNLLIVLGEWWEHRSSYSDAKLRNSPGRLGRLIRWFLPNGGTLILIALLILTQSAWAHQLAGPAALGPSATTVNYQGRLADHSGNPLSGTYGMSFALYDAVTGGNLVWGPESHTAVPVSNGLFSVGLGSQTAGGIPTNVWNGDRYLEITVGGETLSPRELIRSVPIAGMALTVPDGAIGTAQIADGAITVNDFNSTAIGKWTMLDTEVTIRIIGGSGAFNWQVVDLSAFVPVTAKIVYLSVWLNETNGGDAWCSVRPYGSTSPGGTTVLARSNHPYIYGSGSGLVALHDSKIEWKCNLQPGATINEAGIALWGYYEPGH